MRRHSLPRLCLPLLLLQRLSAAPYHCSYRSIFMLLLLQRLHAVPTAPAPSYRSTPMLLLLHAASTRCSYHSILTLRLGAAASSCCAYHILLMLFRASLVSPIFVGTDVDTTCIASLS